MTSHNAYLKQYSKNIDSAFKFHSLKYKHLCELLNASLKEQVAEILDYVKENYPFKYDYHDRICTTVFQQMDMILHRRQYGHQALRDLQHSPNLDWFAEPFFGPRKLKLSKLLEEFDAYRYDNSYVFSADGQRYFQCDSNKITDSPSNGSDGHHENDDDEFTSNKRPRYQNEG